MCVSIAEQLKCKCSPPLCGQSYCHTDYKCYKSASFNSNNQEEILFGCYHASVDVFGTCNGTLDTPTHKIRCCKDNDMCNEDLNVSLVPESDPPTPPVTTQLPSPPPGTCTATFSNNMGTVHYYVACCAVRVSCTSLPANLVPLTAATC